MIRPAQPEDAAACAWIHNHWIDAWEWMPRIHDHGSVERHYQRTVLLNREVWVAGDPIHGFVAREGTYVANLYVRLTGQGIGKALLDHVKAGQDALELWTFQANHGARAFYAREGFSEVRYTEGNNEEGLPDVLLRWVR